MMSTRSALLLAAIACALAACGVKNAENSVNSMPGKLDSTNQQIQSTNEGVRQETMATALGNMYTPDNMAHLSPALAMFPYAQTFAKVAHEDELMLLTHLTFEEIANLGSNETLNAADAAALDHVKLAKLQGMEAIAGYVPQWMVEQIVDVEINGAGAAQTDAQAFLVLRSLFIKTVVFDGDISTVPITNVNFLKNAVDQATYLDYITTLPDQSSLTVNVTGFSDPDSNGPLSVDTGSALEVWSTLKAATAKVSTQSVGGKGGIPGDPAQYNFLVNEIQNHVQAGN